MAKAKKEVEPTVWTIGVITESQTYENGDGDESGEPYSYRGTTSTTWSVEGLRLVSDEHPRASYSYGETTQVAFKPVRGETYHLLYAVYSTGDSFGHDDGRCFEVVGVYKKYEVAEANRKRLMELKPIKRGLVQLKCEGVKEPHEYYVPWNGYFESLDRLEVESFTLK